MGISRALGMLEAIRSRAADSLSEISKVREMGPRESRHRARCVAALASMIKSYGWRKT